MRQEVQGNQLKTIPSSVMEAERSLVKYSRSCQDGTYHNQHFERVTQVCLYIQLIMSGVLSGT